MTTPEIPDPANPDFLHFEQGTLNNPNKSMLAVHLEVALREGDITRSEVEDWPVKPWTIMSFIEGKVSTDEQVRQTTPVPEGMSTLEEVKFRVALHKMLEQKGLLNGLRDWAEAAVDPITREAWEKKNAPLVKDIREAVVAIHAELTPSIGTFEKTERNLNAAKGLNLVENVLRGTKEYVWDEFSEHPEMSIGLVIAVYAAMKSLKGTKLMKGLMVSSAGLIGYTFLRDKFGIRPLEALAERADTLVGEGTGDALRGTADTVTRAIFGENESETINGYYFDKLRLRRDTDRQMFNYMLDKKPKELIHWYDAATAWSLNRGGPNSFAPSDVSKFALEMETDMEMSSYFSGMTESQKIDKMMEITEQVFGHIAEQNGRPAVPSEGLSMLKQKYIDGQYFEMKWNQLHAYEIYLKEDYFKEDPKMQQRVQDVVKKSEDFYKRMAIVVRSASDSLTMKHVLYMEADHKAMQEYDGPGSSYATLKGDIEDIWKEISEEMAPGAWKGVSSFLTDAVPTFWTDVWNEQLRPLLDDGSKNYKENRNIFLKWYEANAKRYVDNAIGMGRDLVVIPVRESKVAELFGVAVDSVIHTNPEAINAAYEKLLSKQIPEPEDASGDPDVPNSEEHSPIREENKHQKMRPESNE